MGRTTRTIGSLLAVALLAAGCGEGDERVRLIEGERSPGEHADVELSFQSPVPGTIAPDGALGARLALRGFRVGEPTAGAGDRGLAMSDQGQHVHFILNNEPYRAVYDLSGSIRVEGADPGFHLLRAFPSRQWHESVKTEAAFATTWFYVPDTAAASDSVTSREPPFDSEAPLLTYSRPKGEYVGSDADSVMVDFFLSNVTLGSGPSGHRVRLTVDDTLSWDITSWAPHYLLGLPDGTHDVRLQLIAPDSTVVGGRFNTTRRTITVRRGASGEGG